MRGTVAALLVAACSLLAACSTVVAGRGVALTPRPVFPPASSSSPATPSAPPTQQPSVPPRVPTPKTDDFRCPTIHYLFARLTFRCVVRSMKRVHGDPVWPLSLGHAVEPHWNVSMGAGHYGAENGSSLRKITASIRDAMISQNEYGPNAKAHTISARPRRIAHHRGFLLESVLRISAATRKQQHVKVHVERQWIVAVQIGRHDYSMWFVSIPDISKRLWHKVPALIASIRVS